MRALFTSVLPVTTAMLVLLAACQSADEMGDSAALKSKPISTEGMEAGCFFARQANDYDIISRVNLVVYAPNRRNAYLLQISPPAISANTNFGIALTGGTSGRICGRPGERLVFDTPNSSVYTVVDVRRLTEEQLEFLVPDEREPEFIEPAPKSPGAEVEKDVTPNNDADPSEAEEDTGNSDE